MNNQIIAADYDNVKRTIQNMESELSEIEDAISKITQAIDETSEWKGPDATAYKSVLNKYATKIRNSSRWLRSLDRTISSHTYRLYQRALNDNSASNFR